MFRFAFLLFYATISIDMATTISAACDRALKLYGVVPKSEGQLQYLASLSAYNESLDFWLLTTNLNEEAHVLVPAEHDTQFRNDLVKYHFKYFVKNPNISGCADINQRSERKAQYRAQESLDFTKRYLSYSDINRYIEYLGRKYADLVTVTNVGKSYEGRTLKTVTIAKGQPSTAILIDAGIHAREWIAPATALYVINRLVQHANENRDLLNNLTWIILPLVNPDGYEYSLKTNKLWRKTRQPFRRCVGTDGNRNFNFHWGEKGASKYECVNTFAGSRPFSEPETQVVRDLLLTNNESVKFYLSLHSYGRMLLYPWGYKKDLPRQWRNMDNVARAGASAMQRVHRVDYRIGGAATVLYEAAGASDDYALAVARIPIAITMELPGDENGFHPAESKIGRFVEEAFTGIRAMALKMVQMQV
ncbi:carboxypeptidase B1-like [Armigeres subalbatus]|uniref:carboxypeptidase B1-like n=1 Tax=Armigeres subalbatus TaxID=124917 RepID=UPI002ED39C16